MSLTNFPATFWWYAGVILVVDILDFVGVGPGFGTEFLLILTCAFVVLLLSQISEKLDGD